MAMANPLPINSYIAVAGLEADCKRMIADLQAIVTRLHGLGQISAEARDAATAQVFADFHALKTRIGEFSREAPGRLDRLDDSVQEHPYHFIAGALAVGLIIGLT